MEWHDRSKSPTDKKNKSKTKLNDRRKGATKPKQEHPIKAKISEKMADMFQGKKANDTADINSKVY